MYNQTNEYKAGAASLGFGVVVSDDSVVVGTPMFNKLQFHKVGGVMKITNQDSKTTFTKFNTKLNALRNKLKVSDVKGNITKRLSENFDISNAYLGWSVMKGIY